MVSSTISVCRDLSPQILRTTTTETSPENARDRCINTSEILNDLEPHNTNQVDCGNESGESELSRITEVARENGNRTPDLLGITTVYST